MNPATRLVDTETAARILGKGAATLRNWRTQGRGPRFLVNPDSGQFLGYDVADIEEWIGLGRQQRTADAK